MRANRNLFWLLAAFFWIAAIVYTVWTASTNEVNHQPEWIGTVGMTLSGILGAFLAFYIGSTERSLGGVLPEDRQDADIDDGDPEVGHFSPWSWWPLVLALGLGLVFTGLAVGVWIAFLGAPIVLVSIIGWNYEYYRGNFGR